MVERNNSDSPNEPVDKRLLVQLINHEFDDDVKKVRETYEKIMRNKNWKTEFLALSRRLAQDHIDENSDEFE